MSECEIEKGETIMNINVKRWSKVIVLILVAAISFFAVAGYASSPSNHKKTIASLDEKRNTVLGLTAGVTTTSALISMIPGDTGTPIAEKVADLSQYLLLILCAVFLEKYMVTITGLVTFKILIPVACILFIIVEFYDNVTFKNLAKKLLLFGIAIYLIVPASVELSDVIENTYQAQINEAIESAQDTEAIIDSTTENDGTQKGDTDSSSNSDKSTWDKVKDGISKAGSAITDTVENVALSADELVNKVQNSLNNFIEAIAVMIITSCVIPILVIIFFIWLVKLIFNVDFGKTEPINRLMNKNNNVKLLEKNEK